jgi:Tol biopolymer transport system component
MSGSLELYVINVDGTGLTQITHDGTGHGLPRWSLDGTHIVFTTVSQVGLTLVIATIAADGSDRKELTSPYWDSLGPE